MGKVFRYDKEEMDMEDKTNDKQQQLLYKQMVSDIWEYHRGDLFSVDVPLIIFFL